MTRERDDQHPEHSQRAQQQYCPAPVPSLASDLPVPSAQAAARALGVESLAHRLPHTASLSLAEPLHLAQAILNFTSREPPETLLPSCVPRSNFSPPPPSFPPSLITIHPSSSVLRCNHSSCNSSCSLSCFVFLGLFVLDLSLPETTKICSFDEQHPPPSLSQMIAFPR